MFYSKFTPCDRWFADDEAYNKHFKGNTMIGQWKRVWFAINETNQKSKRRLQGHIMKHTKVGLYQCTVFGKSYTRNSSLTCHINCVHTKVSKHECEICLKVITRLGHILVLVISFHDRIKFDYCTEGKKSSARSDNLNKQYIRNNLNISNWRTLSWSKHFCKNFVISSRVSSHVCVNLN